MCAGDKREKLFIVHQHQVSFNFEGRKRHELNMNGFRCFWLEIGDALFIQNKILGFGSAAEIHWQIIIFPAIFSNVLVPSSAYSGLRFQQKNILSKSIVHSVTRQLLSDQYSDH